jgi:hypothetical protein
MFRLLAEASSCRQRKYFATSPRCGISVEGGQSGAGERAVERGREQTGRHRDHLLHVAVEPQRRFLPIQIRQQEGVLVALAVGETAADHLRAHVEGGLVESVGEPPAIRPFQIAGEGVERAAINAHDDVGTVRKREA